MRGWRSRRGRRRNIGNFCFLIRWWKGVEGVGGCLGVWPLLDGWFRGLSATTRCVANWKVEFVPRRMRSTEAVRTIVYSVHGALLDIEQLYNIVTS